ncbi:MAG: hypothetical protein HY744_11390 [Deltaproteobacteria bacterium]|nr:hypothetical protein [Deltaproteobacteria bacterium]
MTKETFDLALQTAQAERAEGGGAVLPAGCTITLHAAHDGVSLVVGRVTAVALDGDTVKAQTGKGESVVLSLGDVFAVSVAGLPSPPSARKAGFLG